MAQKSLLAVSMPKIQSVAPSIENKLNIYRDFLLTARNSIEVFLQYERSEYSKAQTGGSNKY